MSRASGLIVVLLAACSTSDPPPPAVAQAANVAAPPSMAQPAPAPAKPLWQQSNPVPMGGEPAHLDEQTGIAECDRVAHLLNGLTKCNLRPLMHDAFQLQANVLRDSWPRPGAHLGKKERKRLVDMCNLSLPNVVRAANATHCAS